MRPSGLFIALTAAYWSLAWFPAAGAAPVKGTLKGIDVEKGTVTLQFAAGGREETFSLASPKVPVISEKAGKASLDDLQPGLAVTLQLSDVGDVEAIVAKAPVRAGTLLVYDPVKGSITVGGKKEPTVTYRVTEETKAVIYGRGEPLAMLRRGQRLIMAMSLDEKSVLSLVALLRRNPDDPRGTIVGVDAAGGTLRFLEGKDGKYRFATYPVPKDFVFIFDGERVEGVGLADLPVTTRLEDMPRSPPTWLRLTEDGQAVHAVVAEPAVVQAVLQAIDPQKGSVAVRYPDGGTETFLVEKDADTRVRFKRVPLNELPADAPASLSLSYRPGWLVGIRARPE